MQLSCLHNLLGSTREGMLYNVQAGATSLLERADATGMVPARLAREKGHRFLAHYLETYQHRQSQNGRHGPPCRRTSSYINACTKYLQFSAIFSNSSAPSL